MTFNRSLSSRKSALASPEYQLEVLGQLASLPAFEDKLAEAGLPPLRSRALEVLQVNVGKMCNQTCAHCHVDAGPDRKEIMTRQTMEQCLRVLKEVPVETVDITGGAPEMHPDFRWFVNELRKLSKHVITRCNLTIITANKKFNDLPDFYRDHRVEIASSLPFYSAERTDRQRGEGVFDSSIRALRMLNHVGYGLPDSNLVLNLVYNPAGAFLPANQWQMEKDFKTELKKNYNVDFNRLFCITNMPVSRFLEYLLNSGNYERYMERLLLAFNPIAAKNVMCRNTLSVGWDGSLYDCDFNQMLDLKVANSNTIAELNIDELENRPIRTNQHCFGCTAGTGSSCTGAIV